MADFSCNSTQAQLLIDKGIRPSVQRLAVYNYLSTHKTHPTVDTIYKDLAPTIPTLSKTTVYNTLKLLASNNIIQTITIENDELRFDADISNHMHFKCTKCGKVFDIFDSLPIPESILPAGFKIQKAQTNLWGICKDCIDN